MAGLLAGGASGCGLCGDVVCGACPSALTLQITDAETGSAVDGVTVTGAEALCDQTLGGGLTSCDVELAVGTYELVLSAPGYVDETVSVTINADSGDSCCSCGYNPKILEVGMNSAP